MKNIIILLITMVALLTACGHRASSDNTADGDSVTVTTGFKVDSIGLEQEDSMVSTQISVDWPVQGDSALVKSIRQYICEALSVNINQEGKPQITLFEDGLTAVKATFKRHYEELAEYRKEALSEGYQDGMSYSFYQRVFLLEDGERYVTYLDKTEGFMGGAHGYALANATTFSKINGQRIGYKTEYNAAEERYDIQDQTLFKSPQSPLLAKLIKEGVRSYFAEDSDNKKLSDEELSDMLQNVPDVDHIPLPSNAPYFTKEGLAFCYQQYEIACYAAGMPSFTIPFDQIRPVLTDEATALIPEKQ